MENQEKINDMSSLSEQEKQAPHPEPATESKPASRPPPLLCLGAPRTGTASLMEALRILGFSNVHHGWEAAERPEMQWQWPIFDRAADASYPNIETYTGKPFTRAEWDELFGEYDAVSDIAAFFAEQLIPTYPEAKVILVERDIEKWFPSMSQVVEPSCTATKRNMAIKIGKIAGYDSAKPCYKMHQGWSGAPTPDDTIKNLKTAYIRHNKFIRENVPKEQLLDFKLTEGWEPLCKFLGKEVPNVPFPHVNDSAAYAARQRTLQKKVIKAFFKNLLCPCLRPSNER
ncbi:hypothetical protein F53441_2728 [Fusarium austroafricanum]|uniref:P-loop containing nucleoside triphosphate hydrolase protein n=1 Tax=Fusarium austroafricanum TaxID=2364996 RepID=A0A8H4KT85_9HYPO|nr:hypothetical protein F53441_2728 [Fusarium austroafricanum]